MSLKRKVSKILILLLMIGLFTQFFAQTASGYLFGWIIRESRPGGSWYGYIGSDYVSINESLLGGSWYGYIGSDYVSINESLLGGSWYGYIGSDYVSINESLLGGSWYGYI